MGEQVAAGLKLSVIRRIMDSKQLAAYKETVITCKCSDSYMRTMKTSYRENYK